MQYRNTKYSTWQYEIQDQDETRSFNYQGTEIILDIMVKECSSTMQMVQRYTHLLNDQIEDLGD